MTVPGVGPALSVAWWAGLGTLKTLLFLLFGGSDRVHPDSFGFGVERPCDSHLFSGELLRRLLVTKCVDFLAVVQNVQGAVDADAGDGALGVGGSHPHRGVPGLGAHVIRDDAGERLPAGSSERCSGKQTDDQVFHAR